jgi:hypothetical protein
MVLLLSTTLGVRSEKNDDERSLLGVLAAVAKLGRAVLRDVGR